MQIRVFVEKDDEITSYSFDRNEDGKVVHMVYNCDNEVIAKFYKKITHLSCVQSTIDEAEERETQKSFELEKENRELKKRICRLETLLDYYEGKETE